MTGAVELLSNPMPTSPNPSSPQPNSKPRFALSSLRILLLLLVGGFVVVGTWYYRSKEQALIDNHAVSIHCIAQLNTSQNKDYISLYSEAKKHMVHGASALCISRINSFTFNQLASSIRVVFDQ